jgi:hypothetical protein
MLSNREIRGCLDHDLECEILKADRTMDEIKEKQIAKRDQTSFTSISPFETCI